MRAFILALAALAWPLAAQGSLVDQSYDHFYNLDYDEAIADFQGAIALQPGDPELHNHLAQTIVFQEMYRNGALESELVSGNNSFLRRPKLNVLPRTESWFLSEVGKAMALAQARIDRNPNDAAALYSLGISYGLRSNYYWVVKKAWHDSLKDATAARRLHNRVEALQPNNVDARLVEGLHDYIIGSLPWTWRALGFLIGMHGDKDLGMRLVQDVAAHGSDNRIDAEFFLCALYRRENQTRRAVPLIQDLIRRFPRNFLLRLELSQMYSMAGDKASALRRSTRWRSSRHPRPRLRPRSLGEDLLSARHDRVLVRDLDDALENMKKVTAADDLDLNSGVYAYLRMGQIYDITNRRALALGGYRKAIAYAPEA